MIIEKMVVKSASQEDIKGEVYKNDIRSVELFQPVGFYHVPEVDAEGLLMYVGNGQGDGILIAPKFRDIITGDPGESKIYNTVGGVVKSLITIDKTNKITIEAFSGSDVQITGTNIKMNTATESFMKGNVWQTNWTTFNASVQAIVPSNPVTAVQFAALQTAFSVFAAQLANMLSTTIKGE